MHGGVMVHGRRERHHGRVLLGAQVAWVPAQVPWVHNPRSVPGVTGVHPYPTTMAGDGTGDGIWCGRSGGLGLGRCVRRGAVIAGRRGPSGWLPLHEGGVIADTWGFLFLEALQETKTMLQIMKYFITRDIVNRQTALWSF